MYLTKLVYIVCMFYLLVSSTICCMICEENKQWKKSTGFESCAVADPEIYKGELKTSMHAKHATNFYMPRPLLIKLCHTSLVMISGC